MLARTNRVITIDLLGFGKSVKPDDSPYDLEAHCSAIEQTLAQIGITEPYILVGHSMGAIIALHLATRNQTKIERLLLLGMYTFNSAEEARAVVTQNKKYLELAYYGSSSKALCTLWCRFSRPISKRLAHFYLPKLPKSVAEDSVLHTWNSYNKSRHNIVDHQNIQSDLDVLLIPTLMINAKSEPQTVLLNVANLRLNNNVQLKITKGSHNFPLENPKLIVQAIIGKI